VSLLEGAFRGDVFFTTGAVLSVKHGHSTEMGVPGGSWPIRQEDMADPDITPILRRRPVFFVDNKEG